MTPMAELINLRNARRRADRLKKEREAEANRLAHGQPKHLRDRRRAEERKAARDLEAHRRERGDEA
jgi:hypothetical protein